MMIRHSHLDHELSAFGRVSLVSFDVTTIMAMSLQNAAMNSQFVEFLELERLLIGRRSACASTYFTRRESKHLELS